MITFTSKEAKNHLGKVFRAAGAEPVEITNHGVPVLRIMSVKHAAEMSCEKNQHDDLDTMKHHLSCEVLARFPLSVIRERSRENLLRWKAQGSWGPTYVEWLNIIDSNDDLALISRMIGLDEDSNRLRQSIPYVGMLDKTIVRRAHEKASS